TTTVATVTDPVSGNGIYTASYTLPTTGTVTGTYTWSASYSGDSNKNGANDQGGAAEQTVDSKANPALATTASADGSLTLCTTAPTISDSAVLSGGYYETGSITFTLTFNNGTTTSTVYTSTVTVSGNGTYGSGGYTLPTTGKVTGTYIWTAHYTGDGNNNPANDPGDRTKDEQAENKAHQSLVTTHKPANTLGKTAPTISDSAALSGGYYETGSITFTLTFNNGTTSSTVYTSTVTVSGNGTYGSGGYTLPTTGKVTGTYTWTAHYSGDGNNNPANDQ